MKQEALIRAIIIDDEMTSLVHLKNELAFVPDIALIAEFDNIPDALAMLRSGGEIDVVFCDIELPGMTGLEAIKLLKKHCKMVVFVTGHIKYALDAYRQWVNGYIVKPITTTDLQEVVEVWSDTYCEEIPMKLRLGKLYLYDSSARTYTPVVYSDVIKILHQKNNLLVYVCGSADPIIIRYTIKEAMQTLAPLGLFLQVNPKTIVNTDEITGAEPGCVCIGKYEYEVTGLHLDAYNTFLAMHQFGRGNKLT